METFAYAIMLVSILGAFAMGLSGLYLNFKYPKSRLEIAEMKLLSAEDEIRRLRVLVEEWRARAEGCEQLVVRSMQGRGDSAVTIHNSDVTVGGDLVGGDATKRDELAAGGDLTTMKEESGLESGRDREIE